MLYLIVNLDYISPSEEGAIVMTPVTLLCYVSYSLRVICVALDPKRCLLAFLSFITWRIRNFALICSDAGCEQNTKNFKRPAISQPKLGHRCCHPFHPGGFYNQSLLLTLKRFRISFWVNGKGHENFNLQLVIKISLNFSFIVHFC